MNSDAARGVELGLYQGLESWARAGYRSHASNNLKTDEETGAGAINRIQVQHIPEIRGWTSVLVDSDDARAWRGRHVAPSANAKARCSRSPMQLHSRERPFANNSCSGQRRKDYLFEGGFEIDGKPSE